MKNYLAFLLFMSFSLSANILDDLIIKKKPLINQIIIELLEIGMTDDWKNLDSSEKSEIGTEICKAGDGDYCSYVTSIGEGICKAGDGDYCSYVNSVQDGIDKIPYKDRNFWWDRFRDQYGNYQWRCRGGQTKQFANDSKCSGVSKDDNRWPG